MAGTKQAPLEAHRANSVLRLLTSAATQLLDDLLVLPGATAD